MADYIWVDVYNVFVAKDQHVSDCIVRKDLIISY